MLVQLTSVLLCVVPICKEGIVVMGVCLCRFCLYERSRGHLFVLSMARARGLLGGVLLRSDVL